MSIVLVTGGTGVIGSHVVTELRARGREVRTVSRHPHEWHGGVEHVVGNLRSGPTLAEAMQGVSVVLHLAGGASGDAKLTARVAEAAATANVRHLVLISVVGADTVPIGYFREKKGAEDAVRASGVPFSILRAAQAHSLVLSLVRMLSKLPLAPHPTGLRFEPVDPRDIADRLVELADAHPAGLVADIAGPQIFTLRELVQSYASAKGKRRSFFRVRIPGAAGRAYRAGDNLASPEALRGARTWDRYLRDHES